ncbi:MAG TPA: SRPBCC domain-containing protein, partial [Thermoanaerobaculia bacterium]
SSFGTPSWWTQMVTVGYERIRGLRERGQRRGGSHEASKSRTINVPVETLFDAFANERRRRKWLPVKIVVRTVKPQKRMRVTWEDGTIVVFEFLSKGPGKSAVALGHQKLPDRATADAMKKMWSGHLDRLGELLS